jgi:sugar phosphate permease
MTAGAAKVSRIDDSLDGGYWELPAPSSRRASRSPAKLGAPKPAAERAEKSLSRSTGYKNRNTISAAGWAVLIATYLAYMSVYCARKPFAVVKPTVQEERGLSLQQLANIDTALLTAYAAGQLSLGFIVRICGGRKRALIFSFLLAGAATAAFGLADSSLPMLGAWALAGLFAAPASPLFSILVGEAVPDKVRYLYFSSCN